MVTCRKRGYLYGALQDLGPRRAKNAHSYGETPSLNFDSFSTELGLGILFFWSHPSVEDEAAYDPKQVKVDEEEETQNDLILTPAELAWCAVCGKKKDEGAGDNCTCAAPHLRQIKIFHRQCPHSGKSSDRENLYTQQRNYSRAAQIAEREMHPVSNPCGAFRNPMMKQGWLWPFLLHTSK